MKRLFAFALASLLLFAVFAFASAPHVETYYSCFFDAYSANNIFGSDLNFDSMIIELYFTSQEDLVYYSYKTLSSGSWRDTGVVSCAYNELSSTEFGLTMPDGSVFPGYFDANGEYVWLDIGAGYFRLHRVKNMNLFEDWTKK